MMKKKIIPILIALLCFSCNSSQRRKRFSDAEVKSMHLDSTVFITPNADSLVTVDLNPFLKKGKEFDFDVLVKSTKYVPLETTDESLLGAIDKVLVTNSSIYIRDNMKGAGIVIFNREGKFIKRIPYGRGPGEIHRLWDIAYDKEHDELIAYQHPYLMFYTSSGKYLRQKKLPFGFYNMLSTSDGYIFKTLSAPAPGNMHLKSWSDCTLLVTDKNFRLKQAGLVSKKESRGVCSLNYLHKNNINNEIQIVQGYGDTIYHYSQRTNELIAAYELDFKDKKLPETAIFGDSYMDFNKAANNNDYYYFSGDYFETNTKNLFQLTNNYIGRRLLIYRDKKSGHLIGGDKVNYNEIPLFFPSATFGNFFISICGITKDAPFIKTSTLLSHEDKLKLEHLTSDDNPVLVFWEMKDF